MLSWSLSFNEYVDEVGSRAATKAAVCCRVRMFWMGLV